MDGTVTSEDRAWAAAAHVIAMVVGYFIPLIGNIGGPLAIYFINKDRSRFVAFHALQATFWVCLVIGALAAAFVLSIVMLLTIILIPVAYLPMAAVGLAGLVISIMAAVKAYNGELYEYPIVGKIARDMVGI